MIKPVIVLVASIGMALGAGTASARDHGSWHNGHQKHKPEWQVREEQRQRKQAQWERDQEWQQQEELRRRAEQQRLRDEAWQRKQEAELRHRAGQQHKTGARQHRHWERGQRYNGHHSQVRDWHQSQLRQPGRGQRWVHDDSGQYLLLETATGLILDAILR